MAENNFYVKNTKELADIIQKIVKNEPNDTTTLETFITLLKSDSHYAGWSYAKQQIQAAYKPVN